MKKNVIIGSLVAGAFLLPALAGAGVVTGRCDKCHTMHASQDGNTSTPNANLLRGNGCLACHAESGATNGAAGTGGTYNAPQVHDSATQLSGGYFTAGSFDGQHNVAGFANEDAAFGAGSGWDIPGNTAVMTGQIICQDCHEIAGHHATPTTYRMLGWNSGANTVAGTGDGNYGVAGRSGNTYDATTMNGLCGSCHGDFHGTGSGDANLGSYGGWLRHPVNITLTDADTNTTRGYVADYGVAGATDQTPTGVGQTVMCLSCHRAHGSAYADIIEWDQSTVLAGGNTRNTGCENCHNYAGGGY